MIAIVLKKIFLFGLYWKKTNKPRPAFVHRPANKAAKDNEPEANSWHNTTVAAQFGIKPNRAARGICSQEPCKRIAERFSSPIPSIKRFKTSVVIKIKSRSSVSESLRTAT